MCREPAALFLTGQRGPAGVYRDMLSGGEVLLKAGSRLPDTPAGTPTLYVRLRQHPPCGDAATEGEIKKQAAA